MKVVRKKQHIPLSMLKPGDVFRPGLGEKLWRVGKVQRDEISPGYIPANCLEDGARNGWMKDHLVEVVPGHWVPDEEDGPIAIGRVQYWETVEYDGGFWLHIHGARCRAVNGCKLLKIGGDEEISIPMDTLVRVVHCTLVEHGAKIEEAGHE